MAPSRSSAPSRLAGFAPLAAPKTRRASLTGKPLVRTGGLEPHHVAASFLKNSRPCNEHKVLRGGDMPPSLASCLPVPACVAANGSTVLICLTHRQEPAIATISSTIDSPGARARPRRCHRLRLLSSAQAAGSCTPPSTAVPSPRSKSAASPAPPSQWPGRKLRSRQGKISGAKTFTTGCARG